MAILQSDKKKMAQQGKTLNPLSVKHAAENKYGSGFVNELLKELRKRKCKVSSARISQAWKGDAPFILNEINTIVNIN